MSDPGVTAKVRVTLEIEFDLSQPWSDTENLANMRNRAHRDAAEVANNLALRATGNAEGPGLPSSAKVVAMGKEVTMVLPKPQEGRR